MNNLSKHNNVNSDLSGIYPELDTFFKNFSMEEHDELSIERFVKSMFPKKLFIYKVLKQGKELLILKDFPFLWIYYSIGKRYLNDFDGDIDERYFQWTKVMIKILEQKYSKYCKN